MKILLISPATGLWKGISHRRIFNGRTFRFSMLSLLSVAALSPKDSDIRIVDEQIEEIPFNEHFDVVGITFMTAIAPRAYEIAERFREKGVKVVFGGFHTTLNPDEAVRHADAIVIGNASGAWENLLEDLQKGNLKKIYHGNSDPNIPTVLPRHLIKGSQYITMNATYATLGCENHCQFCSISSFHHGKRYERNIKEVVHEISHFKESFFMFVDDNLTQNRDYVFTLLKELIPLKKKWGTQASIDIADDDELLGLLRDAGCIGIFIGLETLSEKTLEEQEKGFNTPLRYKDAIKHIHSHGMFVEAGIMFGFDNDDPDVFKKTLELLDDIGVDAIQVSILTPLPGTDLYEKMRDRIVDKNWEHFDFRHVVYMPEQMTSEDLKKGTDWVVNRFYSLTGIFKRIIRWMTMPGGFRNILCPLVLNFAYYGRIKAFHIK